MKKIILILGVLAAFYYYQPELFPFVIPGVHERETNPEVMIFTIEKCQGWCEKTLQDLNNRGVPYTQYPVDNNEENMKLWKKNGKGNFPSVIIGDYRIVGFQGPTQGFYIASYYGHKYLTPDERGYFDNHFYDDGSPRVYMYGASWCPGCKRMRLAFAEEGIDYVELDVDASPNKAKISETMFVGGYPTIFVGYQRIQNAIDLDEIKRTMRFAIPKKY